MANEFIIKNGFHSKGNSQITGSINVSGTITGDGSGLSSVSATPPAGTVSSSAQIASDISGSFTAPSASFSTRVSANEVITAKTLVSSSAQITYGSISSIPSGIYSSSLQVLTNITASGNISSSGTITASAFYGDGSGLSGIGSVFTTSSLLRVTGSVFIDDQTTNSGSADANAVFKVRGTVGNLFTLKNDLTNLLDVKDISGISVFQVSGSAEVLMKDLPTTEPNISGSLWVSGSSIAHPTSGYLMIFKG
jgi:hypothetical protein